MSDLINSSKEIISKIKKMRNKNSYSYNKDFPDGLFEKCTSCNEVILGDELVRHSFTCPNCGFHFKITPEDRIKLLLDKYKVINTEFVFNNPINYPDYEEKHLQYSKNTGAKEALMTVTGFLKGIKVVLVVMDNRFFMGSMSAYVGEEITKAFEYAGKRKLPIIIFSTSGGARMQEGIFSLMQMAKTSMAVKKYAEGNNLYISCFTHPTTGGVSASFASLGDIIIAEPEALIGFAGPRVIKDTIGTSLPEGFQRSELLLENGFLDDIIHRNFMKDYLYDVLKLHNYKVVEND